MFFSIFLLLFVAYIVGSFPGPYLLVLLATGKNLLQEGTKNVGTRNTYRATESKFLTFIALLLDVTKGVAAYFLTLLFISSNTSTIWFFLASFCGVILGHNHSVFLGFKGGKGLATACGYLLFFLPVAAGIWILLWIVLNKIARIKVIPQILATLFTPIILAALWWQHIGVSTDQIVVLTIASIIILLAHTGRILKILNGTEPEKYASV